VHLPFTAGTTLSSQEQSIVDELLDADSRNSWGSGLMSLVAPAAGVGSLHP
jgi:hypothetical protein